MSQKGRQERVRMQLAGRQSLGRNLLMSISIPLEISPYILHSITICSRVWTSALPHGQLMGRWERNLCLYSPMGAWPVVMRVKRVQSELVKPIEGSHEPSLAYVGLITFWFLSSKSRKSCSLLGFDMKDSCHSERILLHFFFLLNRCDSLLGKTGAQLSALT